MDKKKRYLVTYCEEELDSQAAAEILTKDMSYFQDAVDVLSTDRPVLDDDIHHFPLQGTSSVVLADSEVKTLNGHHRVQKIEEDYELFLTEDGGSRPGASQPSPSLGWNIEMVHASDVWHRTTGKGINVAIIDSGIDQDNPDLCVMGGVSYADGISSWNDDHGHGTLCAGVVAARNDLTGVVGVAPDASLFAIKIFYYSEKEKKWTGRFSSFLAALHWALNQNMDVVSMSFHWAQCEVQSAALSRTIRHLDNNNCLMVAASGNSGEKGEVLQPARSDRVIAVGAVGKSRNLAAYSTWKPGNIVDLCAPGGKEDRVSNDGSYIAGDYIDSTWLGGGIGRSQGTSMACPHVAGAAALVKELHPDWQADDIRRALIGSAESLGDKNKTGAGLLDCRTAIQDQ